MRMFKKKRQLRKKQKGFLLLGGIVFGFVFLFWWFNQNASSKILYVAEQNLERYVDKVASDFQIFLEESGNYGDFLEITQNEQGEIMSVDYDMESIYALASQLTSFLQENLQENYMNQVSSIKDGIILEIPLGIVSDSPFLANLGPKIPVCVRFMNSVFSNVKTRLTNYGINNAMLEIYLNVTISYEVILPVTKNEKEKTYELLIDSKLIQGEVPNWFSKTYESESAFLELSFP